MPAQSIMAIFPVAMILLWVGLYVLRLAKRTLSRRALLIVLLIGLALTGLSLLVHGSRSGGTVVMTEYGWPHSFLFERLGQWTIAWGPIASYIIVDIIFYFALTMLVVGGWLFIRRRPTLTE